MFEEMPREGRVFGVPEKGFGEMGPFADPHLYIAVGNVASFEYLKVFLHRGGKVWFPLAKIFAQPI